jgi:hypothetical protein
MGTGVNPSPHDRLGDLPGDDGNADGGHYPYALPSGRATNRVASPIFTRIRT